MISPDSETPNFYTLITYGVDDIPLTVDGRLVFFRSPASTEAAYKMFNDSIKMSSSPPTEMGMLCDVAGMLYTISQEDLDESVTIVNCLNVTFDLIGALEIRMPDEYRKALYEFADHLTFDREFASYLREQGVHRETIINAFLWCLGAIALKSQLID